MTDHTWNIKEGSGLGKSHQEEELDKNAAPPHFQSLPETLRRGEVDRVMYHDLDRAVREPVNFLRIKDFIRDRDVELETPDHPA